MPDTLCELELQIHQTTPRAVLVSNDGDVEKAVWLPLSQVEIVTKRNGIADVTVPEWLARERGLI